MMHHTGQWQEGTFKLFTLMHHSQTAGSMRARYDASDKVEKQARAMGGRWEGTFRLVASLPVMHHSLNSRKRGSLEG